MKILYYSDVHCEVKHSTLEAKSVAAATGWTSAYPLCLGPNLMPFSGGQVDLLILAGDIAHADNRNPKRQGSVTTLDYAEQASRFLDCPVVVVPGNHEYYRGTFDLDQEHLLSSKVPGVTVLDRGVYTQGNVRILGTTLWTNYLIMGEQLQRDSMRVCHNLINDHRAIFKSVFNELWTPHDALVENMLSTEWLLANLRLEPFDGKTIIVTHHVPHSVARHPNYAVGLESGGFMSDCNALINAAIDNNVVAWIFGHHHYSMEVDVGGLKLLSAQMGYAFDHSGRQNSLVDRWDGPQVLEI